MASKTEIFRKGANGTVHGGGGGKVRAGKAPLQEIKPNASLLKPMKHIAPSMVPNRAAANSKPTPASSGSAQNALVDQIRKRVSSLGSVSSKLPKPIKPTDISPKPPRPTQPSRPAQPSQPSRPADRPPRPARLPNSAVTSTTYNKPTLPVNLPGFKPGNGMQSRPVGIKKGK